MSKWAVVENDTITEYYDVLPENWRNVSNLFALESDIATLEKLGIYPVKETTQSLGQNQTYGVINFTFDAANKVVIKNAPIIDVPAPVIDTITLRNNFMNQLRTYRDLLMSQCDWTMIPDVVALKGTTWQTSWANYRQALRDLPEVYNTQYPNETDVNNIVYPTQPSGE